MSFQIQMVKRKYNVIFTIVRVQGPRVLELKYSFMKIITHTDTYRIFPREFWCKHKKTKHKNHYQPNAQQQHNYFEKGLQEPKTSQYKCSSIYLFIVREVQRTRQKLSTQDIGFRFLAFPGGSQKVILTIYPQW